MESAGLEGLACKYKDTGLSQRGVVKNHWATVQDANSSGDASITTHGIRKAAQAAEDKAAIIQDKQSFAFSSIPYADEYLDVGEGCIPIPDQYLASYTTSLEVIDSLRERLFEVSVRRDPVATEVGSILREKFMEWVISSGNSQRLLELVKLDSH